MRNEREVIMEVEIDNSSLSLWYVVERRERPVGNGMVQVVDVPLFFRGKKEVMRYVEGQKGPIEISKQMIEEKIIQQGGVEWYYK